MKKILAALLAASFILIPLSGCGEEDKKFSETVVISAESPSFETDLYSVSFGTAVLAKDTEMTVSEVDTPPLFYEGEPSRVYNFSLDKMENLTSVSDFTIPFVPAEEEVAVAAYWDGSAWQPVNYTYENGAVTIHTEITGTYGAFSVKRPGVRDAAMALYYIPSTLDATEQSINFFSGNAGTEPGTSKCASFFSNIYSGVLSVNIGSGILSESGFDEAYVSQYTETAAKAGSAFAVFQTIRSIRNASSVTSSLESLRNAAKSIDKLPDSFFRQDACKAVRAATAYLDFCVTPYKEEAPSTMANAYKAAYDDYYSDTGKGHRDTGAWYRELYALLSDGFFESANTTASIKNDVSTYSNALWDDPKLLQEHKNKAIEAGHTDPGKLTKDIKNELINELEGKLYGGAVKEAMLQAIKQLEQKAYREFKAAFEEYCDYVYRNVSLTLYTSTAVDDFAGCTVSFENQPESADGDIPPCTLNSNGEGTIGFRVFSFLKHGLRPVLTVTDDEGNTKRLEIPLHVPNNEIDLSGAK